MGNHEESDRNSPLVPSQQPHLVAIVLFQKCVVPVQRELILMSATQSAGLLFYFCSSNSFYSKFTGDEGALMKHLLPSKPPNQG